MILPDENIVFGSPLRGPIYFSITCDLCALCERIIQVKRIKAENSYFYSLFQKYSLTNDFIFCKFR